MSKKKKEAKFLQIDAVHLTKCRRRSLDTFCLENDGTDGNDYNTIGLYKLYMYNIFLSH